MFILIKQFFIVLLRFPESLAPDQIKCMLLNDKKMHGYTYYYWFESC